MMVLNDQVSMQIYYERNLLVPSQVQAYDRFHKSDRMQLPYGQDLLMTWIPSGDMNSNLKELWYNYLPYGFQYRLEKNEPVLVENWCAWMSQGSSLVL